MDYDAIGRHRFPWRHQHVVANRERFGSDRLGHHRAGITAQPLRDDLGPA